MIGSPTEEGGDIIVYADAVGTIAFQLDSDAIEVGIGVAPVAGRKLQIQGEATDTYGVYIDLATVDYTGTALNFGLDLRKDISTGSITSGALLSYGLDFYIRNYRDIDLTSLIPSNTVTAGAFGIVYDYGDIIGTCLGLTSGSRGLRGVACAAFYQGQDTSDGATDVLTVEGAYLVADSRPTMNKGGGQLTSTVYGANIDVDAIPTLTAGTYVGVTYGVYAHVNVNPSADLGTHTNYGGCFIVIGTTEGTSICYGVYADASGADVNWAGYFADGDVLIENTLHVDVIVEETLNAGVIVEGVAFENNDITMAAGGSVDAYTNSGYIKVRRISQSAMPIPQVGEILMWRDIDDDRTYLVYEDPDVGTRSVRLL